MIKCRVAFIPTSRYIGSCVNPVTLEGFASYSQEVAVNSSILENFIRIASGRDGHVPDVVAMLLFIGASLPITFEREILDVSLNSAEDSLKGTSDKSKALFSCFLLTFSSNVFPRVQN